MDITITYAEERDWEYLVKNDDHIKPERLRRLVDNEQVIVLRDGDETIGWLRFGFFWDTIPFMNMFAIEEEYRCKGLGTQVAQFWEAEMRKQDYDLLMTSTQVDERAQHLYRRLGYRDCGGLVLRLQEPLELFLVKPLKK